MDNCRTEYEEDLPVPFAGLFHLARNFMYCEYFDFFGGDSTLHESKRFAISGTLEWLNADAIMSSDDLLTYFHFMHWFAISALIGFVNDNSDIHFDIFYLHPMSVETHLRGKVRGGIKVSG